MYLTWIIINLLEKKLNVILQNVGVIDVGTGWIKTVNKNVKLIKYICKSVLIIKLFNIKLENTLDC
jgi:hypothetical protein